LKAPERDSAERLLVAAAQKDPGRFADLYEQNFERVYAFILRRVENREAAQDLTSEVFHKALENLKTFEWRGAPFAAWLYRIAANAMADHWRRTARRRDLSDLDLLDDASPAALDAVEHRATLFRLVGELPADQRRVVELRFARERSIREIAHELGRSEGAVKQLQFRALQTLRARMGKADG